MTKLDEIPKASVECADEDHDSRKVVLTKRLEADGHRTIAVGRAIVTVEHTDSQKEAPAECQDTDVLKLSIYPDPDVSGDEQPVCLYLAGGRYGLASAHLQVVARERQRIFKMEERLVRDEL